MNERTRPTWFHKNEVTKKQIPCYRKDKKPKSYSVENTQSYSSKTLSRTNIIMILDVLIVNILFVTLKGRVFQQTIGINSVSLFWLTCSFIDSIFQTGFSIHNEITQEMHIMITNIIIILLYYFMVYMSFKYGKIVIICN